MVIQVTVVIINRNIVVFGRRWCCSLEVEYRFRRRSSRTGECWCPDFPDSSGRPARHQNSPIQGSRWFQVMTMETHFLALTDLTGSRVRGVPSRVEVRRRLGVNAQTRRWSRNGLVPSPPGACSSVLISLANRISGLGGASPERQRLRAQSGTRVLFKEAIFL